MSGISHSRRDHDHLRRHIRDEEDVRLRDVTTAYAMLAIAGPRSPDLLGAIMDIDISDGSFPPYELRHGQIGHAPVIAQRLSFTGETGWEILITPDFAEHVLETILQAGEPSGLRLAGGEALNALRIERGFLHWGADMAYTEAPHQMGLDFTCKADKPSPFIGRDAYLARKVRIGLSCATISMAADIRPRLSPPASAPLRSATSSLSARSPRPLRNPSII